MPKSAKKESNPELLHAPLCFISLVSGLNDRGLEILRKNLVDELEVRKVRAELDRLDKDNGRQQGI